MLVLVLLGRGGAVMAEMVGEFECRLADLVRRIEVSRVVPERPLPCRVVYKKPIEEPGVSSVLWDAAHDPAYCEHQARELVGTLDTGGWACTTPAPGADGTIELSLGNADPSSLDPALRQAVSRDLETLKGRGGKRVAAKVAAPGDLDGDGVDDAPALITSHVAGPDRAQYLVACLFEDGGFRAIASRLIGGQLRDAYNGEVEGIEDGAITFNPCTPKAGDASRCPSGRHRTTVVFREVNVCVPNEFSLGAQPTTRM